MLACRDRRDESAYLCGQRGYGVAGETGGTKKCRKLEDKRGPTRVRHGEWVE